MSDGTQCTRPCLPTSGTHQYMEIRQSFSRYWQEITKPKSSGRARARSWTDGRCCAGMRYFNRTINLFADLDSQRLFENRPGEGERMKFAVFTAGIHSGRQRFDEIRIDVPAHVCFIQIGVADAADGCAKAERDKFADEFARINFPDRKNAAQSHLCQIFLAPAFEVF